MLIDITPLSTKKVTKLEFDLEIQMEDTFDGREIISYSKPVTFKGKISRVEDFFLLDGEISAEMQLSCGRCLEKFTYPLHMEIHEKLTLLEDHKDEDIIFIDNDKVDISEIIENNIILALPIQRLCREDCKGLCQHCGAHLNYESRTCQDEIVDPRFQKLKDLF